MSVWVPPWASEQGRTGPWLGSPWRSQRGIWLPSWLFRNGEQGAWYEPLPQYLYQDAAGTTPVTADGDPVGLMLDRSRGLVLGPESMPADLSVGWSSTDPRWVYSTESVEWLGGGSGAASTRLQVFSSSQLDKFFLLSFTISGFSGAGNGGVQNAVLSIEPDDTDASGAIDTRVTGDGDYEFRGYFRGASGGGLNLDLLGREENAYTISNISVRELPGNHASQSVAASRPLYSVTPPNQVYETIEDEMVVTLPSIAAATVAIATTTGADIQYPVDLSGGSYTINQSHSGIIILDRQLTASELASVTNYLNQRAGV